MQSRKAWDEFTYVLNWSTFYSLPNLLAVIPISSQPTDRAQGTGEAIRGNFNAAVDSATGDHESAQRQQNIASRGVDEFETGNYHGTGAGVTPIDTDRERINRAAQGESATVTSTNHGPHGTNIGNKLDPRFDSDCDHRGSATGPGFDDGEAGLRR